MKFKKSIALIISVVMVFTSLTSIVTAAAVSDIAGLIGLRVTYSHSLIKE